MSLTNPHLIIGHSGDYHARAVAWALGEIEQEVLIWDGIGPLISSQISFDFSSSACELFLGSRKITSLASAWFRRPVAATPLSNVQADALTFLRNELKAAHTALEIEVVQIADFVVADPRFRSVSNKVAQLKTAVLCGLSVPRTIVSNDLATIEAFLRETEDVLVKHFTPHFWKTPSGDRWRSVSPARIQDVSSLDRRSVELCPAIYQQVVDKDFDIRAVVIGEQIFSARIDSRNGWAFFDWRSEYANPDFSVLPFSLPISIENSIRGLMSRLNLVYGSIDLAVDKKGRVFFLEINPDGQFLFLEKYQPQLHLLNAFTSMLAQRSTRYRQSPRVDLVLAAFELSESFEDLKNLEPRHSNDEPFVTTTV